MIRERFDIDNKLILNFLNENKYDSFIGESIVKWYALLGDKDIELGRLQAIKVIQGIASEALLEINFPEKEKEKLIAVFNPLESLLRTAHSLNIPKNNNIKVRDHLSHTIRNLLFSNYLLKYYHNNSITHLKRQLCIATIFHDIGYPIEKLKKIGNNLKDGTFRDLLNSSGKIEFSLDRPDDLLEIMDFFGRLWQEYKTEDKTSNKQRIQNKIKHIYQKIITPAIAGKGLFDSPHYLSSVILFLRPILKNWKESNIYMQMKIETICDICLAIAYHDRKMPLCNFKEYNTEVPLITKILRITDELQEWDRVQNDQSFIKDVEIDTFSTDLSIRFVMKNSILLDCDPNKFIPDKILGLAPVVEDDTIILEMIFPKKITKKNVSDLEKNDEIKQYISHVNKSTMSSSIKLTFHKTKVKIDLV